MATTKKVFGIDPDIEKSGFAAISGNEIVKKGNLSFFKLLEEIDYFAKDGYLIAIEQGERNKHLFTAQKNISRTGAAVALKVASDVGKNYAASTLLVQYCIKHSYAYTIYVPKSQKWTHIIASKAVRGLGARSNQEVRDAVRCAMLC